MSARLGGEPLRARFASARDRLTILNTPDSPGAQRTAVVVLGAITVVLGLLAAGAGAQLVPPVSVLVPVLFGGFTLRLPLYRLLSVLAALMVAYDVAVAGIREVRVGSIIVIAITALIGAELSRTRQLVGVSAIRRESMLIELVDQLRSQSDLPPL
ncbi:MAG TPA: hypothetical protein VNE21_03075, partial [Mycobacteriales bacterium]|nr:hypothetical protein [Mycobacteriales bacterium]